MIRADIETIIMASGPVPSLIVLRERSSSASSNAPTRTLSIQTGSFEAASISRGIDGTASPRPITHDLLLTTLTHLGAKLERVEITRYEAPVFYATLTFVQEQADDSLSEVTIDARPSDALALAVRANAPIYIEDEIMNRAGTISLHDRQQTDDEELRQFDQFVQTLSPDDF